MLYPEFANFLSALNGDTPLGQIVNIRAEKNSKRLKEFTKEQKKIRKEWLDKNREDFKELNEIKDSNNLKMILSMLAN